MKNLLTLSLAFLLSSVLVYGAKKYPPRPRYHQHYIAQVARKSITIPIEDSNFVAKYSAFLGVKLDSCCNRKLIAAVASWLGAPYMAGGRTKSGTDCSGFVSSIYREVFGVELSHGGITMFRQMRQLVKRDEKLREGDILFFRHRGNRISHVAIYLKDGLFIHAATYGRGVVVDDLHTPYYRRTYMMAGRVFPEML